jgi:CheY-like chemotaxis protein
MDKVAPEKSGGEFDADQILIVEDEILIRLHMAEELRDAGFIVAEASGADEAIAVLKSTDEIGLVLTDIRMPGTLDGIALAKWIRRERPNIRIALVSANIHEVPGAEVDAVFGKPVRPDQLIGWARQLLKGKRSGPANR